jgi:DnaK suppressor protein
VAAKRKNTAKKTGKARTAKERLTPAEIQRFEEMLLQKRKEILQNVAEIEGETLRKSRLDASGDLSSMPIHMADLGTDNFQQEFSLGLMDSERKLLVEIEDALHRIERGTYGICEGTGKPIPKARLEAQPWARYSIEYTRMLEEGLVQEGEQP